MGNRRVHLEAFERLVALLLRGNVFERGEVVHAVRKLNDDDADVLRHRHQHFSEVFRLLLLARGERDLAELCDALGQVCNFLAEQLRDLVVRVRGILDDVVEQAGNDRRRIHAEFDQLARHGDRMDDVRLAGLALLLLVRFERKFVALLDQREIIFLAARRCELHEVRIGFGCCCHLLSSFIWRRLRAIAAPAGREIA